MRDVNSRGLRVLHLLDSLRVGGKERQHVELLKGLQRRGEVESMVVTMGTEQFYVPDIESLGIPLRYLIRKVRWDPTVFTRLFKALKELRPKIIHSNSDMALAYAWPLARILGIRLVNGTIRNAFSGRGLRWRLHMLMLSVSDANIGNSRAGFVSRGLDPDGPGNHVIYNGFDQRRFIDSTKAGAELGFDPGGRKLVAMIAEFSKYKDYPTFIRAAMDILSRRQDVEFVAVGGGETFAACRRMIPPDCDRFHFLGPRKDVEALVSRMEIGVLATFTEGISNSVMEFMAAGKPVVVTDGGGSRELIQDSRHGFLVPPSDVGALVDKLEWLLDNPTRGRAMGAAGLSRLKDSFSLEQLAARTLTVYRFIAESSINDCRRLT